MLEFTNINRSEPQKRNVIARIKDFDEVYSIFDKQSAEQQSLRCIGCGDPYCHTGCPLHNIIPAWLKQTANSDLELAFNISNEVSPFPEILGRICPHDILCEGACTLNDTHGAISIGSIETYITEEGFNQGLKPKFNKSKLGKKVALVGSGPSSISVATFLLRNGVDVVMYERDSIAGGLLTFGIPGFKLDKSVVQRRIDFLIEAGMELKLNCEIGKDISFDDLQKNNDAVFIGIGATKGKKANIQGEDAKNVFLSMEFLTSVQNKIFNIQNEKNLDIDVKDKSVVVIGGGDTAMDCVRSSIREGASSVRCLYRRDEANMPGSTKEFLNSKDEGAEFIFNIAPVSICEDGVKVVKTKLVDENNSRGRLENIENSEYIEKADIVLLALGFDQELPEFITSNNFELDKWNGLIVDKNFQTSIANVYSGGDSVRGASLAVNAAADGRDAAKAIVKMLEKS